MPRTTIHMHVNIHETLTKVSEKSGIPRSDLLKHAVKLYTIKLQEEIVLFSSIQYQNADEKENWTRLHVSLSPSEYEHFLDIRKLFKMSVSLFVARAIEEYLEYLSAPDIEKQISDDSPFPAYSFITRDVSETKTFMFCWGIPTEVPT